jgi:hypothetical protein
MDNYSGLSTTTWISLIEPVRKILVRGGRRARLLVLLLARRQALARLHPLEQGALGVADGPADLEVGGPVAPHARLRQPGEADLEDLGRFLGGEQGGDRHGRLLRRAGADGRRLRSHFELFPSAVARLVALRAGRLGPHRPR